MKKAIIIGATSGIGQEVARLLVRQGWRIGIAGRREEALRSMQQTNPEQIEMQCLDVTEDNAILHLNRLVDRLGGMDLFLLLCKPEHKRIKDVVSLPESLKVVSTPTPHHYQVSVTISNRSPEVRKLHL